QPRSIGGAHDDIAFVCRAELAGAEEPVHVNAEPVADAPQHADRHPGEIALDLAEVADGDTGGACQLLQRQSLCAAQATDLLTDLGGGIEPGSGSGLMQLARLVEWSECHALTPSHEGSSGRTRVAAKRGPGCVRRRPRSRTCRYRRMPRPSRRRGWRRTPSPATVRGCDRTCPTTSRRRLHHRATPVRCGTATCRIRPTRTAPGACRPRPHVAARG